MRSKRFLASAVAGVTAAAFIGGCAANELKALEPKLELRNAAQHLADAQQAGFTIKLTGSADDLIAAVKTQDEVDADGVTALRTLFGSTVTLASDKAGDGADDDRALLAVTVDGVTGTEIRVIGPTLYAKAPVAELAKKFGAADGDVAELRKSATADTPALGAFFDGGWVSVDVKEAGGRAGLPAKQVDPAKTMAEVQTSAANLLESATIARDPADDKHLTVTSSTTKAHAELKRLLTAVSGAEGADLTKAMGQAPKEKPIVLDLWIDDEKLTAAEVNVLQFIDGAAGRGAVRLEVTTGTEIAAPDKATKIDTSALPGLGGTGLPGAGPGPIVVSDPVATAEILGFQTMAMAATAQGKPADHLKKAIAGMDGSIEAKIVKRGVAEVTAGGGKACLKLPKSIDKDPVATEGPC